MKPINALLKSFFFLILSLSILQCKKDEAIDDEIKPPIVKQEDIESVDSIAQRWMNQFAMPGLSLAVSKNGKLVYSKSYGYSDTTSKELVTTSTPFRIASVSKLITSVAIMKLVEEEKISMDQKIFGSTGILGTTYGTTPYKLYVQDVTVSDLLHHTSGGWGQSPTDPAFLDISMGKKSVIDWTLNNLNLSNAPNTSFAYSNFNYMLLGQIVEKISGKSYSDYVKDNILQKVGANNTYVAGSKLSDKLPKEAKYYGQSANDINLVYQMNLSRADAAMGWLSTPTDLLKFATAVDSSSTRPDILKLSTIKTMVTTTPASTGWGFRFGCGWVIEGNEWFWWGTLPGTFAILYRNGNGICIAATANSRATNDANSFNSFVGVINYIAFEDINWQNIDQF